MKTVKADHGIVRCEPERHDGYFAWGSAAVMEDGTVAVAASGYRTHHVDPFGKTVVSYGTPDKGFGAFEVVNNSLLDDRDAGITAMPGNRLLLTWFTIDSNLFLERMRGYGEEEFSRIQKALEAYTPEQSKRIRGSYTMRSDNGGKTWNAPVCCPVSAPHGASVKKDGTLVYLGKEFPRDMETPSGRVACAVSRTGDEWEEIGVVPVPEGKKIGQFHEPHVIELPDGTLLGMIRYHYDAPLDNEIGIYQTSSSDGGKTWSTPEDMNILGSPPHLLLHSSGAVILSYGWRHAPYGQRARVSMDNGRTWGEEIVLRDDGPDADLGYPCSVELLDGSILTVYYQKPTKDKKPGILWTRWRLGDVQNTVGKC